MKDFAEILSNDLISALGWTLLHSLWQSLAVLALVFVSLRIISSQKSSARYALMCAGFLLFVGSSVTTFLLEYNSASLNPIQHAAVEAPLSLQTANMEVPSTTFLPWMVNIIQSGMPFIVGLWAIGFLFFSSRLLGSFLTSYRLTSSGQSVDKKWESFIEEAAAKLRINRIVTLAESALINSPVVIGYFKPVILIPVGMFSGLTTEQVETIFWHELAHIKRHDYLVNLGQTVVETIFFFNPFVQILSNEIRKEREYCCDDLVIRYHGGSRAYALALTQLAEASLSHRGFALALADNSNQLFKRIRRIMERSSDTGTARGKFLLPVILTMGALLCISWLGTDGALVQANAQQIQKDTIPDKGERGARYSRKSIITLDENGQPHEEIVEEFEGDERLRPLLQHRGPATMGGIIPSLPNGVADPTSPLSIDTIPPTPFQFDDMKDWEDFAKSFEDAFSGRFEEFYGMHPSDSSFFDMQNGFLFPDTDAFRELHEQMEELQSRHFGDLDEHFNLQYEQIGGYETKLRDELIKDGYLSENEQINSLEWNNDTFKVNGKSISPKHREKYRKLNEEFFGPSEPQGKVQ